MTLQIFPFASYRDVKNGAKLVVIRHFQEEGERDDHMKVFVLNVVSDPVRDRDPNKQVFMATCESVDDEPVEDGDIELEITLNDVGCPRFGTRRGLRARSFVYTKEAHEVALFGAERFGPHLMRMFDRNDDCLKFNPGDTVMTRKQSSFQLRGGTALGSILGMSN